ncbi:phosphoglucosamine mutase, partial [Oleiphilus sp. HI0123]
DKDLEVVAPDLLGKAKRIDDAIGRYVECCKATIPSSMSLTGMKIVLDCAHGATYQVAPYVFKELGAEITTIGVQPDGLNINRDVGSTSPQALVDKVLEVEADLGIAFDGDGDRVIMVDHKGEVVDGDELIYIIARNRQQAGRLEGGVVGTLMTNFGAELALQKLNIPFVRANVGDRYVMEQLVKNGWELGGENSGHIICFDKASTGDATIAALQVLISLWRDGKSLHELKSEMTKLPQVLKNVRIKEKTDPMSNDVIAQAVKEQGERLAGQGRVLLRGSGTEPLIRVMAEGEDADLVNSVVNSLVETVQNAIG